MIDYLTFIDELKEIKTSLGPNTDNATMRLINEKQTKYEKMMSDFESEEAPIDHVQRARENAKIEGFIS
tara:strand:+ start:708 stop:914 length:207 start_codon:yes stop_codon:yes gene_type:complete